MTNLKLLPHDRLRLSSDLFPIYSQGEREHEHERELLTNSRAQTKAIANASTY
jgi:hypothetical protein